jgi:hypothetical protein
LTSKTLLYRPGSKSVAIVMTESKLSDIEF